MPLMVVIEIMYDLPVEFKNLNELTLKAVKDTNSLNQALSEFANLGYIVSGIEMQGRRVRFTLKRDDSNENPNQCFDASELFRLENNIKDKTRILMEVSVESLGLSPHACRPLLKSGFLCLGDIVSKSEPELYHVMNLGRKSIKEIKDTLKKMSERHGVEISLGMKLPQTD